MRSWRTGSITLGISLVAFGVGMLISKFTAAFTLIDAIEWWPVLLILLGCEVLAAFFLADDKSQRIRFDGGSIFIIALMLVFCMAISSVYFLASLVPGGMDALKSIFQ
jgi:hypothetical protein